MLEEMIAQARAEMPNECCGLLAAPVRDPATRPDHDAPLVQVEQRYPLGNAAASPVLYESDARSHFEAEKDIRRRGLEVVAVYHSHPTSDPIPSKTDLERNYSEDVINFIISLKGETPVVRGWWLSAEGFLPAEWELIEEPV